MKTSCSTVEKISTDLYQKFKETIERDDIGFFRLPRLKEQLESSSIIFNKFSDRKVFVQIGIGGSALGPQMLIDALDKGHRDFVFLDNTDPEDITYKMRKINIEDCLFYVVSKSGSTAETMANFFICRSMLLNAGISKDSLKDYFIFCTDPVSGELREYASQNNYLTLEVPSNIGGRFSVLSTVGLLPAMFAAIDCERLLAGAVQLSDDINQQGIDHDLFIAGQNLIEAYNTNKDQIVLMPYSSRLKTFSHWFVQLWGESLGKINSLGKSVSITPIPAYGATDQHSQMQLFMEGKNDKSIALIEIERFKQDFEIEANLNFSAAKKLSGKSMGQLIGAQLSGTLKALQDRERNTLHFSISQLDEFELGKLILFFESLTVLLGNYLQVDPFNQPGVELGKKYAYDFLDKTEKRI